MAPRKKRFQLLGLEWDRLAELALIAIAALVTAQQANSAAEIVKRQAAFDSLQASYVEFTKGHAEFKTSLYGIRNALTVDVEEIAEVDRLDRERLERLRLVVEPIVAAKMRYEGTIHAAVPLWPRAIRDKMLSVMQHGVVIAECYEAASMRALTDEELRSIKNELNRRCRGLGQQSDHFNQDEEGLYIAMAQHLRRTAEELGAAEHELLSMQAAAS